MDATWFRDRWAAYARRHRLPADRSAVLPPLTVGELEKIAREFFAAGAVHREEFDRSIDQLIRLRAPPNRQAERPATPPRF